ncbi:MAG: transcriptional regulator [Planctomycetes bacterium]|nr:transcriptional regulator [Planctomycetota bacterium]
MTAESGRYAYDGLERVLHERARLGIVTSLVAHPDGLAFSELKELCALTDGNLNRHLKVLVDEGILTIAKEQGRHRGTTVCRITPAGRRRLLDYLQVLESVVSDARAVQPTTKSGKRNQGLAPA